MLLQINENKYKKNGDIINICVNLRTKSCDILIPVLVKEKDIYNQNSLNSRTIQISIPYFLNEDYTTDTINYNLLYSDIPSFFTDKDIKQIETCINLAEKSILQHEYQHNKDYTVSFSGTTNFPSLDDINITIQTMQKISSEQNFNNFINAIKSNIIVRSKNFSSKFTLIDNVDKRIPAQYVIYVSTNQNEQIYCINSAYHQKDIPNIKQLIWELQQMCEKQELLLQELEHEKE